MSHYAHCPCFDCEPFRRRVENEMRQIIEGVRVRVPGLVEEIRQDLWQVYGRDDPWDRED